MKMSSLLCSLMLVLASVPAFSQDAKSQEGRKKQPRTIVDELGFKGFNVFKNAVISSGLEAKFTGKDEFTFLAPTDVAFRDLPKAQLDALLADKEKLKTVVENHTIAGKVASGDLKSAAPKTLAGTAVEVKSVDGKLKIQTATVVKPDVAAPNGVIHGIDKLLVIP